MLFNKEVTDEIVAPGINCAIGISPLLDVGTGTLNALATGGGDITLSKYGFGLKRPATLASNYDKFVAFCGNLIIDNNVSLDFTVTHTPVENEQYYRQYR